MRTKKEWTVKELSIRSGVSVASINNIEAGKGSSPTLDILQKLSSALCVNIDKLLEENLVVYHSIEIKNKAEEDLLKSFYALPTDKKEFIIKYIKLFQEFLKDSDSLEGSALLNPVVNTCTEEILLSISQMPESLQCDILDIIKNIDKAMVDTANLNTPKIL